MCELHCTMLKSCIQLMLLICIGLNNSYRTVQAELITTRPTATVTPKAQQPITTNSGGEKKAKTTASTTKAASRRNPQIDELTAMLYHVENTESCGNNLQRFNIDLEPLWSSKFSSQMKKSIQLANTINSLIRNSSSYETSRARIFDIDLLPSLAHFMFQLNPSSNQTNSKSLVSAESPFLLGYGVVMFVDGNSDGEVINKSSVRCLFVKQNPAAAASASTTDDMYTREDTCKSMNLFANDAAKKSSPLKSYIKIGSKNLVSGNNNGNSAEDPSYNCLNWLNNLKWTYKKFQEKLREERTKKPAAFGSDGGDAKSTAYQTLLEQLISERNLSSSLWCGPYYECSSETASMSAMTSASSSPFKLRSSAPNADGSSSASSSSSSSSSVLSSFRTPLNLFAGGASSNSNKKKLDSYLFVASIRYRRQRETAARCRSCQVQAQSARC